MRGLNAAFIALIPKSNHPASASDYQPISLIGSVYKLIAKVLTGRLQKVMPYLLSETQFTFTKGRQIADRIMIANEVVDAMNKSESGGILLKLDFAKAYDNVDWNFLLGTMSEMGFGQRWITWIHGCISTGSLAFLVNGSPTNFFAIEKGLRQGDPLSPLLFNICANVLSCMLQLLLSEEVCCGYKLRERIVLNHLQFADDTLIFCEPDPGQLSRINDTLEAFLWASGLKVNFSKSHLYGCKVDSKRVSEMADSIDVSVGELPFGYLSVPLGGNPRRIQAWKPLIEKMRLKLIPWRSKFLSLIGRLVVLKAVLSAVPIYYMAIFKAPTGVVGQFES